MTSSSPPKFSHITDSYLNQVDKYIDRLWRMRDKTGKQNMLTDEEMMRLCINSRPIFLSESSLINLKGPLKVCGDIHGQYTDLLHLFELCGKPDTVNYLFLGDYVDRGLQSLETISLLLCYKIRYPYRFFLLRGNHESQAITKIYGFFDECKRRFSIKLWRNFIDTFNCFPVCAIIENQIFCCHGGISPDLFLSEVTNLSALRKCVCAIQRPCDVPEEGLLCDLLWSDPCSVDVKSENAQPSDWEPNERGVSYVFSPRVVDQFLERFNLDLIVRAHQVVEDGYEFFASRSLVTIFSAPNYCGEFDNAAAIFCLSRISNATKTDDTKPVESILVTDEASLVSTELVDLEGSFQIMRSKQTDSSIYGENKSNMCRTDNTWWLRSKYYM